MSKQALLVARDACLRRRQQESSGWLVTCSLPRADYGVVAGCVQLHMDMPLLMAPLILLGTAGLGVAGLILWVWLPCLKQGRAEGSRGIT
jgi:hypothetical protein